MSDLSGLVEEAADAISAANNDARCVDPRDLAKRRRDEAIAALRAFLNPDSEALVECATKGIREEMGPVFGTPEYLAKPGNVERLEARQQAAAEKFARAALTAISLALSTEA